MTRQKSGWWNEFFPTFRPLFGLLPERVSNAEARYIREKLRLSPGGRFLDCPCGIGRIAIPLAKARIKVTGVDITQSYLDELTIKAQRRRLPIEVFRRDMRRIDFVDEFDGAGNLWTSFGYFMREADNLLVLKKMFRALKPGGRLMLHLINRDWIMAEYEPRGWFPLCDRRGKEIGKVLEKRHFDYRTSINHGSWTFIKDGREREYQVDIRMYSFHELIKMFTAVGFTDIEGYGTIKEEPIGRDHRMMFILGVKPNRSSNG